MKPHPLSEIFPVMTDDEVAVLANDIRVNKLREPIVTYREKILDGRNREIACRIASVTPRYTEYTGKDPLGFIVSANLRRRHLDTSQRAMVAAKLANMPQGRPEKQTGNFAGLDSSADLPENLPKVSQAQAAEALSVSERTVRDAKKVLEDGSPEQVKEVETGKKTAARTAKEIEIVRAASAEGGPEVYADLAEQVNKDDTAIDPLHKEFLKRREILHAAQENPTRYGPIMDQLLAGVKARDIDTGKLYREFQKRKNEASRKKDPLKDAKGKDVPSHLRDKFATNFLAELGEPHETYAREIIPKTRRHVKSTDTKFAYYRSGEALQLLEEIEDRVKRLFALGIEAKPYMLCPFCEDKGHKGCKRCNQSGYLTKSRMKELEREGAI